MGLKYSWLGLLVGMFLAWVAPPEIEAHLERIGQAWQARDGQAWLREVLWMVERHPDSRLFREEHTLWAIPSGAEPVRGRLADAWLRQVERNPAPAVIDNAFRAVAQTDFEAAERLLKRARRLYPADPRWTDLLASLYASAVIPSWRHSHLARPELVTPEIAARVRRELGASGDAALLWEAGRIASLPENPLLRQAFGPPLAGSDWSDRLLARARELDPEGRTRHEQHPTGPIRVGTELSSGYLLRDVKPVYPREVVRIQGNVIIAMLVRIDGTVEELQVVSGHPLLVPAAEQAVRQWRYKPVLLNGEPVAVVTQAVVPFTLSQ